MHNPLTNLLAALLLAAPVISAEAQFSSGSDGSDGPISVGLDEAVIFPLPSDGVINATTVSIATGGTLQFTKNGLNTPVHLLATGDIVIDGTVIVDGTAGSAISPGRGGPGGFDGGFPSGADVASGNGLGPGAGIAGANTLSSPESGSGSYGGVPAGGFKLKHGVTYGSHLLLPLVGGSGAAGVSDTPGSTSQFGGAGGGGAILLASTTGVHVSGLVSAKGGSNPFIIQGSGGAIRIVAPTLTGAGTLDVSGGESERRQGGPGRIRLDVLNSTLFTGSLVPTAQASSGTLMLVFPPDEARLDIVSAAGQIISGVSAVQLLLPFDAPTSQEIVVQASNFTGIVPIRVTLTPEHGAAISEDAEIDMSQGNPATATVTVNMPVNEAVRVHVWTRTP